MVQTEGGPLIQPDEWEKPPLALSGGSLWMCPEQAWLFGEPIIKVLPWTGLVDSRGNSSIPAYPLTHAWVGELLLPGPACCPCCLIALQFGDSSLLLLCQSQQHLFRPSSA